MNALRGALANLRETIDNTYIFSTSRQRFGEIIASRSRRKPHTNEIFKHLELCSGEEDFLFNALAEDKNKIIAVTGNGERDIAAILFVKDFCGIQSLGMAIEIFKCAPAVLKRSLSFFEGELTVSERVRELVWMEREDLDASDLPAEYSDTLSEVCALEALATFAESSIYDVVCAAGSIAGINTDVGLSELPDEKMNVARQPVAGRETLAILSIMAMAAREYSTTRSLSVAVKCFEFGIAVKASFEMEQKDLVGFDDHISDIASSSEMILSARQTENRFECDFLPYIRDVGLVGVKAPREIIEQLFYLN